MVRAAPLVLALLLLPGCRYNFLPVVPQEINVALPVRVTNATLKREGTALVLRAGVSGRFEPGYLGVRWYNGGAALAQDSVYLDAGQREATFRLDAPDQGAYRAVLLFGDTVLRQVELYEVQP